MGPLRPPGRNQTNFDSALNSTGPERPNGTRVDHKSCGIARRHGKRHNRTSERKTTAIFMKYSTGTVIVTYGTQRKRLFFGEQRKTAGEHATRGREMLQAGPVLIVNIVSFIHRFVLRGNGVAERRPSIRKR